MVWSLGRPLTRSNLSPTLMPALSPGPLGMTPLATRKPECSFHQTPSVGVVYWDSFCQLMTANTTLPAVSNASTTAEKRTNESFRIRCFPNLSTPGLRPEDEGVELDRSNWDAIQSSDRRAKLNVCLDLQNYKCFNRRKLPKLVFRCGFLYFQFLGEMDNQGGAKSLKIAELSWRSPAFRSDRGDNIVFECPKRKSGLSSETMQIEKLTAEIDRAQIHYSRLGTGRPLLLLHGLLGGSFCWRRNIEALSQRHTVFALDLPGHGENDALRHVDCSMAAQSKRVLFLIESLSLQEVDVVGCSWGGAIAMLLAAQSPKVRSLVLAAPVNPWSTLGLGRIKFFNGHIGEALLRMAWPFSRPLYRIALARMYGDPRRLSTATVEGYRSQIMRPGRVDNILNTLRSWEKDVHALRAVIPKIKARTLLIWGTRDSAVDIGSAEALKHALPDCQLKVIEGAGHLPFEETPEEFNRLVLDFIDA